MIFRPVAAKRDRVHSLVGMSLRLGEIADRECFALFARAHTRGVSVAASVTETVSPLPINDGNMAEEDRTTGAVEAMLNGETAAAALCGVGAAARCVTCVALLADLML